MRRALFIAISLLSASAIADDSCPPPEPKLDAHRTLRALSLDLRGDIPEAAEYERVAAGSVPEEIVDEWLDSDAFLERAVRFHRDLLWNNVTNIDFTNYRATMWGTETGVLWRGRQGIVYRGDQVPCLDQPAEFVDGAIVDYLQEDGTRREGWVEVEPYWYPGTVVKVCAYDAQDTLVTSAGTDCGTGYAFEDPECGCGPNLQWCRAGYTQDAIAQGFGREVELRIEEVLREDRSYLDLFTGTRGYVNGPLVHYWRHMTGIGANVRLTPEPVPVEALPDLTFDETDEWVPVELSDEHAGILTSPVYLVRFQTNRSRANRFYQSFLCQPFQPPQGGLPAPSESVPVLDLQERDGCKYCHGLLEPSASYWGRWTESGAGYLDPTAFPPMRDDCSLCAETGAFCSDECRRHYVVSALTPEEEPWLGWLRSYEFRRPEHVDHVEGGPQDLAMLATVDGRLPACSAQKVAEWLLGRAIQDDERPWVEGLATDFVANDMRWKDLVRAVVMSDVYRRVQ